MAGIKRVFAAAVLATALAVPAGAARAEGGEYYILSIIDDILAEINEGLSEADIDLINAIEKADPAAAQTAVANGARVNLPEMANGAMGIERNPLVVAVRDLDYHPEEAAQIVKFLLEQGAVPTVKVMQNLMQIYPEASEFNQTPERQEFLKPIYEAAELLFARADETFTPDNYTEVFSETGMVACDAGKLALLLDRGANPNDPAFLLDYRAAEPSEKNSYGELSSGTLPLHNCLKNYLLNPNNPVSKAEMLAGANLLLSRGADPALLLENPEGLYARAREAEEAFAKFGAQKYEVTPEERALLQTILQARPPVPSR